MEPGRYLAIWIPHKEKEQIDLFEPNKSQIEGYVHEGWDRREIKISIEIKDKYPERKLLTFKVKLPETKVGPVDIELSLKDSYRAFLLLEISKIIPNDAIELLNDEFFTTTLYHEIKKFYHEHNIHKEEELLRGLLLNETTNWLTKIKLHMIRNFYEKIAKTWTLLKDFIEDLKEAEKLIQNTKEFSQHKQLEKELHDSLKKTYEEGGFAEIFLYAEYIKALVSTINFWDLKFTNFDNDLIEKLKYIALFIDYNEKIKTSFVF
jgi:hypothetical protein